MGKVIIPNDEVWAWNGSLLKPNPEHFEQGHTTGATGKKPRHDQFNYLEQRRDLNLQYLLRMAGLPYDPLEVYPINARASKNGHMYISLEDNNKGNDPISSGKWKHEDDDKYPVGTVVMSSSDKRNPADYKGFGTWELIEAESSFNFVGDSDDRAGTVTGNNNVSVPLPIHSHGITVNSTNLGTKTTNTTGNHNHTTNGRGSNYGGSWGAGYASDQNRNAPGIDIQGNTYLYTNGNLVNWNGNHSHTVSLGSHSHSASCANAGNSDASIDVKGKVFNLIGWIRTK